MKSHLLKLIALGVVMLAPAAVNAESWLFRPSYYSHDPVTHVRIGRQYASGPVFTRPTGSYMSGGYRWVNNRITIGGTMYDNYNYWEVWNQGGQQF